MSPGPTLFGALRAAPTPARTTLPTGPYGVSVDVRGQVATILLHVNGRDGDSVRPVESTSPDAAELCADRIARLYDVPRLTPLFPRS